MLSLVKMPRYSMLLLSTMLLTLSGMCWLWYVHTHPNLRDKVSHIRRGMLKQDVHELLGGPPGDYRTVLAPSRVRYDKNGSPTEVWNFDDGDVMVMYIKHFDERPNQCWEVRYAEPGSGWQFAAPPFTDRLASWIRF